MTLRLLFAASLLAACAAPAPRTVLLESASYGCGAADGLGCGLAIAPVLHRIDALDGVAGSSVSWDGRTFRIEIEPGADPEQVGAAAAALLEGEACCVTESRGKAAPGEPDRWYDEEGTLALSRHEASVIAAHYSSVIAAEVALEPATAERLHTVLREELERAFEQAHAEGGGVHRLMEQLPESWPRFEARMAELLTPEQLDRVTTIVGRELGQ
jgi:hypothetical protein